ncbi:flagellar basal body L-ring protein FlgH [Buchnera aphidicola]|uniref:flagellar basal body L-ring protein FlgH n=1 Tax=Buchnera aphidicola TaxID=9 RepID=UPI00346490A7
MKKCFLFQKKYYFIIMMLFILNGCASCIKEPIKKNFIKNISLEKKYSYSTIYTNINNDETNDLFQDNHKYKIGDTITVLIQESFQSKNQTSYHFIKQNNQKININIQKNFLKNDKDHAKKSIENNDKKYISRLNKYLNKNIFITTITTQITDIDSYGNFKIYGEKKISCNEYSENIQFSGIINPKMIDMHNSIPSSLISNLHIKYCNKQDYPVQKNNWIKQILFMI